MFGPSRSVFFPVLWPRLTSHSSLLLRFFSPACETSPGKSNDLPPIYLPHLHCKVRAVLDFGLFCSLVRFAMPYMRFLFVRPGVCPQRDLSTLCIRLPSDSASRRTPLPLANSSYCQVCSGLSPPSRCPCRAHKHFGGGQLSAPKFVIAGRSAPWCGDPTAFRNRLRDRHGSTGLAMTYFLKMDFRVRHQRIIELW